MATQPTTQVKMSDKARAAVLAVQNLWAEAEANTGPKANQMLEEALRLILQASGAVVVETPAEGSLARQGPTQADQAASQKRATPATPPKQRTALQKADQPHQISGVQPLSLSILLAEAREIAMTPPDQLVAERIARYTSPLHGNIEERARQLLASVQPPATAKGQGSAIDEAKLMREILQDAITKCTNPLDKIQLQERLEELNTGFRKLETFYEGHSR